MSETAEKKEVAIAAAPKTAIAVPKRPRKWLRFFLLVLVPVIAATGGLALYLYGGRYITTDNAYVSAQKVLVTPEVSGKIDSIAVTEGQHLKAGDLLFTIDRRPYELALAEAKAALTGASNTYEGLKAKNGNLDQQIATARDTIQLRQDVLTRKLALVKSKVVATADVDADHVNLQDAKSALQVLEQTKLDTVSQLGGDPNAPLDSYARWLAAKAAFDRAQWNLDQTVLRAPVDGIATEVPNIQMGRYLDSGTTVFAIISDQDVWVDANPKETDITWLKDGQPVSVTVDAFPTDALKGHVASISPGTGAEFSLIPAQNAAGNWVKVVQRVPVRIEFDRGQDLAKLRSGMSAYVSIDTGRARSLATLLGSEAAAQTVAQ